MFERTAKKPLQNEALKTRKSTFVYRRENKINVDVKGYPYSV